MASSGTSFPPLPGEALTLPPKLSNADALKRRSNKMRSSKMQSAKFRRRFDRRFQSYSEKRGSTSLSARSHADKRGTKQKARASKDGAKTDRKTYLHRPKYYQSSLRLAIPTQDERDIDLSLPLDSHYESPPKKAHTARSPSRPHHTRHHHPEHDHSHAHTEPSSPPAASSPSSYDFTTFHTRIGRLTHEQNKRLQVSNHKLDRIDKSRIEVRESEIQRHVSKFKHHMDETLENLVSTSGTLYQCNT